MSPEFIRIRHEYPNWYHFPCFGIHYSPLYDEVILLCLDLGELDAAIAIVADMETTGINVPDQTLDRVISARQEIDTNTDDLSL